MAFWDRVFTEVSRDYPDIRTESLLVDAACMDLVRRPQDFDVLVASNLFGDILTDLSAAITGSIGLAPSANLNPSKAFPSLFEPVHGSAPDIAGRGIANPMATMLAGSMMLDFLGETAAAAQLDRAVIQVLTDSRQLTPDLGGTGTTATVTDEVVAELARDERAASSSAAVRAHGVDDRTPVGRRSGSGQKSTGARPSRRRRRAPARFSGTERPSPGPVRQSSLP